MWSNWQNPVIRNLNIFKCSHNFGAIHGLPQPINPNEGPEFLLKQPEFIKLDRMVMTTNGIFQNMVTQNF